MNANKLFSELSIKKIWDKLLQHDKAMNSTLLVLSSGNWIAQEDGTFKNTVSYSTFKDTDKLTVDLYDDGTLSETILTEYEQYIDGFEIVNGALVATANTKPTQTFTLIIKGDFESNEASIGNINDIIVEIEKTNKALVETNNTLEETNNALGGYSFFINPEVVYISADNLPYEDDNGNYIFSDSETGRTLLADTTTYTSNIVEGNFYRTAGADSVNPFKGKVNLAELTIASATAAEISAGYTAWVNGELITGTRPAPVGTQSGTIETSANGKATVSGSVNFSTPFDVVPSMRYSMAAWNDATNKFTVTFSNVTRTGFTWSAKNGNSTWQKTRFVWTAYTG